MTTQPQKIPAGEFKAKCLRLMDDVNRSRRPIVITKRGTPIAKLVPMEKSSVNLFGCLEGALTINDDIIEPIDVSWDAEK